MSDIPELAFLAKHGGGEAPLAALLQGAKQLQTEVAAMKYKGVKAYNPEYLRDQVGGRIRAIRQGYRDAATKEVKAAGEKLNELAQDWRRRRKSDPTASLLDLERERSRVGFLTDEQLQGEVADYERLPVAADPSHVDVLGAELSRRGLDMDAEQLRAAAQRADYQRPWLQGEEARAATRKLHLYENLSAEEFRVVIDETKAPASLSIESLLQIEDLERDLGVRLA